MADEQEALRLAQSLSMCIGEGLGDEAAAMLRKLVAEREEYRAAMRRALEALEQATTGWNHEGGKWLHVSLDAFPVVDAAITDLRQRLEGTT